MEQITYRLAWHFDAHTTCLEGLRYILLEMHPTYHRAELFSAIRLLCQKESITSYGLYEVYGPVDLVFSAWIPSERWRLFLEDFKIWKDSVAPPSHVKSFAIFDAEGCCHHWLWNSTSEHNPENPVAQSLNFLRQHESSTLGSETLLRSDNRALLDELSAHHLVRSYEGVRPEIRFFVMVSMPPSTMPERVRQHFTQQITKIALSVDGIHNIKIYDSRGHDWILIDASVAFNDYHSIAILQSRINESGIRSYMARTTTYLCTDNVAGVEEYDELNFRDRAPLPPVSENYLVTLLSREESPQLEIKGSLRMNMHNFFEKGERKPDQRVEGKILETIVAFFNSDGGEIVIGALEPDRFKEALAAEVGKLPLVGRYRLCGIDVDLLAKGGPDAFNVHLGNIMQSRIGVASARVETHHLLLGEKSICLIRVPRSAENQYLDGKEYIIRHGASSRVLTAAEQEQYQRNRK
jgi:hypothetical protein